MNEFLQWYWDWGIAVSGVIVFFLGFIYGAVWYKDRCEKRIHAENVRLAITNTSGGNKEQIPDHLKFPYSRIS